MTTTYRIDLTHPDRPALWTYSDLADTPEQLARFVWRKLTAGWTVTATPTKENNR